MDNATFHKRSDTQKILESRSYHLWLPPYGPDLNPIEKIWARLKCYVKNGGSIALTLLLVVWWFLNSLRVTAGYSQY